MIIIEICFIIGLVIVVGIGIRLLFGRDGEWSDKALESDQDYFEAHPEEKPYIESPEEREARLKHEALVEKFYYELGPEEEKRAWEERKKKEVEKAREQERREKEWKKGLAKREKEREENLELFRKAHGSVVFEEYLTPYSVCSVVNHSGAGVYSCRI